MNIVPLWRVMLWVMTGSVIGLLCGVASAFATDEKDLTIGLKTLPLLESKITGTATTAVVFDPSSAASKADAEAIKAAIDANPSAPTGVILSPIMVPVSDIGKLSSAKIAFIAQGTSASFSVIASAASRDGILTISADLDCVKAGKCILGVVSMPNVEIYYSKAAADAAKINFSSAFTMLVKQI